MTVAKRDMLSQQIDAGSIIATVHEPMLVLDANLYVIFANRSFYDSFHVDEKETEGQCIYDLGNGQWDIPALKLLLEERLPQNTALNDVEVEHEFPEIGQRTMLLNARRIYKEHKKTQFILLAIEDITEHMKTRAELRARNTQLSLIKTHTCDIIFAIGVKSNDVFRFLWVNQRFLEVTGLEENQIVGNPIQEVIPEPTHELVLGKLKEAIRTGKAVRWEETSVYPAGKKTGEVSVAPVFDASRNCTQLIGTVHDITRQKQAYEELAASEEKFSRLANESLVGIYIIQDGVFKYINPRLAEIFGYAEEEFIDRLGPEQLVFEGDKPLVAENIRKRIEGVEKSTHYTFRGITRERKVIDIEAFGSFTHYQGQAAIIGSLLDITEQKKNEQSLVRVQKQTRQIIDTARDAFVSMDAHGNITDWNPQAEESFGWRREEALGQPISKIIIPPESRQAHEKGLKNFLISGEGPVLNQHVETNALHRDGYTFPVELSIVPAYNDDCVSFHAFIRNLSAQVEARKTLKDSLVGTIVAVARAVEARDPYTAGHQQRVAQLARSIAQEMGMDADKIDGLRMGATIHDIGKIYLPSEILSKPTRLSETEFDLIKTHCQVGYDILKDIKFPWPIADIAHQHHERMDGTGYPQGLKGDEICLEARIVAVADVVEAINSHRPYREGLGIDIALQEIKKHRDVWYEPAAVDACLNLFRKDAFSFE